MRDMPLGRRVLSGVMARGAGGAWSLEWHVLWRGPGSCSLASCLRVRRCACGVGTSGAHSLASSIVSLVFLIVSFVFISFIVIISLHT